MLRAIPFLLLLFVTACAGPAPVVVEETPEPEPEPETAAYSALVRNGGSLELRAGEALQPAGEASGVISVHSAAAGQSALVAVAAGDSTRLLLATSERVRRVHAVDGRVVYTVAWAPGGDQAAFGYYRPAGTASQGRAAMGAGDILLWDGNGVSRVGCSASRAVLAWAADGALLVRNTDNLYVVSRDGCDTRTTVDARRMLGLTVSPDARHLAFVHRELEYDRSARAYVADSTFRLTDLDGSNEKTIVNFRYNPRRLAWRPDGAELAFDVKASDEAGRAISIFEVASGTTAFLHPPASDYDEFGPVWSPEGDRIAYHRGDERGANSVWVRSFELGFPRGVPDSEGATIEGWAGGTGLVFRRADGTVAVYDAAADTVTELGTADEVAAVWPLR